MSEITLNPHNLIQRIERLSKANLPFLRWNRGYFLQTQERIPIMTGGETSQVTLDRLDANGLQFRNETRFSCNH